MQNQASHSVLCRVAPSEDTTKKQSQTRAILNRRKLSEYARMIELIDADSLDVKQFSGKKSVTVGGKEKSGRMKNGGFLIGSFIEKYNEIVNILEEENNAKPVCSHQLTTKDNQNKPYIISKYRLLKSNSGASPRS